jgi:hemerythrin
VAIFEWNDKYSIGVKEMDRQHQVLFSILNDLHEAMLKGIAQNVTGDLLQKLIDYTKNHFAAEESLMTAARYPGLAGHLIKHKELLMQVDDLAARQKRGEIAVSVQLMQFLRNWLTTHIQQEDRRYSASVIKHAETNAPGKALAGAATPTRN